MMILMMMLVMVMVMIIVIRLLILLLNRYSALYKFMIGEPDYLTFRFASLVGHPCLTILMKKCPSASLGYNPK